MRFYCHKKYVECSFSPYHYLSKSMIKHMASFAGWNLISTISYVLSQQGLGIVLNSFFGTFLNAAMGIANQISGMLSSIASGMTKALNPVIVKAAGAGNNAGMLRTGLVGCKYSFFFISFF